VITTYTWTPTVVGTGSLVGMNCAPGTYVGGTSIGPCTATAGGGSAFSAWSATSGSAACSGATNPCGSFSLAANSATTATFVSTCTLSFSPVAGSYTGTQNVTISKSGCAAGTTVYYRTDGLPATVIDTAYSTPISISSTQTLTAIAVVNPTIRDQPQTLATQKKCNAVGSPITFPSGYSCNNGSGGVAGTVSDFNFVAGASNQYAVTSTDSTDFDSSILHIDTPTTTPDVSITQMSYRNVFQDSSNCSQTSANLYKCIDVSEFDAENAKDPTTNALWQMSARCSTNAAGSSGNNGFLEGDASSGNEKWDIPCVIGAQTDATVNVHWVLGDTGCGGAGCMVLDSIYLKTGAGALTKYDFPASCDVSDTNCPNYPMTAHPSFSNFTAGSQQQIYTRNVSVAGTSPLTTTRNTSFLRVGVDEGNQATGSAAYTITLTRPNATIQGVANFKGSLQIK
jgi:hypothetical protein